MSEEKMHHLTFNAHFIENIKIDQKISSNCKLRSKFVHERIFQSRDKIAQYSVNLLICEKGVKIMRPLDQMLLSSHSIQRISYSACDRINQIFVLVVRSSEVDHCQMCYIFRMDNAEQADSINRYFGSIFKQLNNKKKERKLKSDFNDIEKTENSNKKSETLSELPRNGDFDTEESADEGLDPRLRQISTSNIDELVSEKHSIRRRSLCMPNTELEDVDLFNQNQQLHPSLEKKLNVTTNNNVRPLVRRKKPEYKGNRISAVIERLSFRGSREMSADFLKSGSPVVALKEQLEYEELLSAESSLGSDCHHEPLQNQSSQSKKQLLPSLSNLHINNDSKAPMDFIPNLVRKNSAPLCNQLEDEQPPVPPVRIHSLRNTTFPKTLTIGQSSQPVRGCGEGASINMLEHNYDDDDHLSSITTPSSCGQGNSEPVRFSLYNEPPPPSRFFKETPAVSSHINHTKDANSATTAQGYSSNVPLQYFRNLSKDGAMEFLLDREVGGFLLRDSASHPGCLALSVKVADNLVSHYIVQFTANGYQMKGLDKTWPSLQSLITHLSVIPEMLPCPIRFSQPSGDRRATYITTDTAAAANVLPPSNSNSPRSKVPPQSQSADDEYQERMKHFLCDTTSHDQYQQLSDFSSIIAGLDFV